MANPITLRKISGTWTLRAGRAVLAESAQVLKLREQTGSTQIYFPKSNIAMALLEPSDHTTDCPQKGTAQYFPSSPKVPRLKTWPGAMPTHPRLWPL